MKLREGDLIEFGVAYDLDTQEAELEITKKGDAKPLAFPLDETVIVFMIDNLSTVLTALRTGKPPRGWEDE